ncbi:MAG: MFS transporter [Deltaproteobacteria bacterium]|nr:MFS transporter [Deltaproteobacteria bacterium]
MTGDAKPEDKVFHGWKLVGALSCILFFTAGGGLYVFPVFIGSLQQEFGWSMTQVSGTGAVFAISMGLSNPVVGTLFARFGTRNVMLIAAGMTVLTSLGYASLQNLAMLYAIAFVAGFSVAATTILPAQTLVTNWFRVFRGRAMGITMLGIGAGGLALPPFNEFMIRLVGWRMAWVVAALVVAGVVIPLIAVFVRATPADLGLVVDGVRPDPDAPAGAGGAPPAIGLALKRAVATRTFWLVIGIFLLQLIAVSAMNFHFIPFATQEAGLTPQNAAFYFGLAIGFSIPGRLGFGWLADRWSPSRLMAFSFLLLALGPLSVELLLRLGLSDARLLWLYAIPFGVGIGGNAVTMPILVGRCFGELHFSRIMGLLMSSFAAGILVGIPGAGAIFDRTGSYEWVFILSACGLSLAMLLCLLIAPDRYRDEFAGAEQSAA